MERQMEFSFVRKEQASILDALDEETLRRIVELIARMVVTVHEKRKVKKNDR